MIEYCHTCEIETESVFNAWFVSFCAVCKTMRDYTPHATEHYDDFYEEVQGYIAEERSND